MSERKFHFSPQYSAFTSWSRGHIRLAAPPSHALRLGDVEERLNAAAQVHDAEDAGSYLAVVNHKGVVWSEGHECHRRQVVGYDDGQDDEDHLKGLLLHWVHLLFSQHRAPENPDDGDVAEDHDGKGKQDDAAEDLVDTQGPQEGLADAIGQDNTPDQHWDTDADPVVADLCE